MILTWCPLRACVKIQGFTHFKRKNVMPHLLRILLPGLLLLGLLIDADMVCAQAFPAPPAPADGQWYSTTGAPLTAETLAQSPDVGISSLTPVKVTLQGVKPGCYRVGLLIYTGFDLHDPYNTTASFLVSAKNPDGTLTDMGHMAPPADAKLRPVRQTGKEKENWAPWRGYAESTGPLYIDDTHPVIVRFIGGDSSIFSAIRLTPITDPVDCLAETVSTDVPDHAFFTGVPPKFAIKVYNAANADWSGKLRVDCYDMRAQTMTREAVPIEVKALGATSIAYSPNLSHGVFRLNVRAIDEQRKVEQHGEGSSIVVANSPAKWAKDLPDDWPLATHHSNPSPILKRPIPASNGSAISAVGQI
jgi:hypothetical protein